VKESTSTREPKRSKKGAHRYIDYRIEHAELQLFQRYFFSRVLRLSLMLIHENISDSPIGLVLPSQKNRAFSSISSPGELLKVGESLIGWLGPTGSFYTFLDAAPSFEFPDDFRILRLQKEATSEDNTLIVVPRRAKSPTIAKSIIEVMRHLLTSLYEDTHNWHALFGQGMRDLLDPLTDFYSGSHHSDIILNGLADMVVHLGGHMKNGQQLWRFCCILLPKDLLLPLQQRSLVVRAQSKNSPHNVGLTTVSTYDSPICLSLRAYQSGHIIYRSKIADIDSTVSHRQVEGPIRSAIAVPVGGGNGLPLAVLYVASDEIEAFSVHGQCLLRNIGKIVEELLMTYHIQKTIMVKLADIMIHPGIVDISFGDFGTETEFRSDVEGILSEIKKHIQEREVQADKKGLSLERSSYELEVEHRPVNVVSFIAIDVDNHSSIANQYGDQLARNLSREVGLRLNGELRTFFTKGRDYQLYHAYAGRFYLLLKNTPHEEAQVFAEHLRNTLRGPYQVDALRISIEQPTLPGGTLVLPNVTVRLAVTSYKYTTLKEFFQKYYEATAISALINLALEDGLKLGEDKGGNVVISWSFAKKMFESWLPRQLD